MRPSNMGRHWRLSSNILFFDQQTAGWRKALAKCDPSYLVVNHQEKASTRCQHKTQLSTCWSAHVHNWTLKLNVEAIQHTHTYLWQAFTVELQGCNTQMRCRSMQLQNHFKKTWDLDTVFAKFCHTETVYKCSLQNVPCFISPTLSFYGKYHLSVFPEFKIFSFPESFGI